MRFGGLCVTRGLLLIMWLSWLLHCVYLLLGGSLCFMYFRMLISIARVAVGHWV